MSERLTRKMPPVDNGWKFLPLEEACTFLPAKSIASDGDTEIIAVTTACLTEHGFNPDGVKRARMWRQDVETARLQVGEILIARSNTSELVGRAALYAGQPGNVVASDLTIRLLPKEGFDAEFVAAYFSFLFQMGYWRERASGASGSMKKITRGQLAKHTFSFPSIREQRRISAWLKEQMAEIARARRAAESQWAKLTAFRNALIREMFLSEAGVNWRRVRLGEVCDLVNGKAYNDQDWAKHGVPIIRIQNLNNAEKAFNYWRGSLEKQVVVKDGDVLLAWSGTPGTSFGTHRWKRGVGVLNQHIFRVDLDLSQIDPDWAVLSINEQLSRLIDQAHGAVGLRHVTRRDCDSLEIACPPIVEQKHLAASLYAKFAETDSARAAAKAQIDAVNQLPAAFLREAFAGNS